MTQRDNIVGKVFTGSLIIFLGTMFSRFANILYKLTVVRYLGPSSYGILTLMMTSISLFWATINPHVSLATARQLAVDKDDYRLVSSCFWYYLTVGIISGASCIVLGDWVAKEVFHIPHAAPVFKVGGLLLLGMSIQAVFSAIFSGFLKFEYETIVKICKQISLLILAIISLGLGWHLMGVLMALVISELLGLLCAWMLARDILPSEALSRYFDTSSLRKLLDFGMVLYLVTLVEQIGRSASVFSLGILESENSVGEFNVALGLSSLVITIPRAVSIPLVPALADRFTKKGQEKLGRVIDHLLKFTLCAVLPFTLLLYIFSDTLMIVLFGEKYLASIPILRIIVFGGLLESMVLIFQSVFIGFGIPMAYLKCALATTLIHWISTPLLTSRLGMRGTAIGYLITAISGLAIYTIVYTKATMNSISKMQYMKAIMICIVSCAPTFIMRSSALSIALLQSSLSIGLYILLLITFKVLDKEDFRILSGVRYLRPAIGFAEKLQKHLERI